jgi:hypothetical protein
MTSQCNDKLDPQLRASLCLPQKGLGTLRTATIHTFPRLFHQGQAPCTAIPTDLAIVTGRTYRCLAVTPPHPKCIFSSPTYRPSPNSSPVHPPTAPERAMTRSRTHARF